MAAAGATGFTDRKTKGSDWGRRWGDVGGWPHRKNAQGGEAEFVAQRAVGERHAVRGEQRGVFGAVAGAEIGELGERGSGEIVDEEIAAALAVGDDDQAAAAIEPKRRGAGDVVRVTTIVRETRNGAAGENVARDR